MQSFVGLNRRKRKRRGHYLLFYLCASAKTVVFFLPLYWDLHHQLPGFSGLWTQIIVTPLAFLGFQFADAREQIMGFLSLQNHMSQFLDNKLSLSLYRHTQTDRQTDRHTHTHTHTHTNNWFCFSGEPWTIQWGSSISINYLCFIQPYSSSFLITITVIIYLCKMLNIKQKN